MQKFNAEINFHLCAVNWCLWRTMQAWHQSKFFCFELFWNKKQNCCFAELNTELSEQLLKGAGVWILLYWQIWNVKPVWANESFSGKLAIPQRHLAKGCTKELLDVTGIELALLESGAARNRARYQLCYWAGTWRFQMHITRCVQTYEHSLPFPK